MSDDFDQYDKGDLAFTRESPYGTEIEAMYSGATSFMRRRYSRDLDLRVSDLAFDNNGDLWAITWPDRGQVVKFNDRARAETPGPLAYHRILSEVFGGAGFENAAFYE